MLGAVADEISIPAFLRTTPFQHWRGPRKQSPRAWAYKLQDNIDEGGMLYIYICSHLIHLIYTTVTAIFVSIYIYICYIYLVAIAILEGEYIGPNKTA